MNSVLRKILQGPVQQETKVVILPLCVCMYMCVYIYMYIYIYINSSSGIAVGYTEDKHYETCNFDTKNRVHKANTVGLIP